MRWSSTRNRHFNRQAIRIAHPEHVLLVRLGEGDAGPLQSIGNTEVIDRRRRSLITSAVGRTRGRAVRGASTQHVTSIDHGDEILVPRHRYEVLPTINTTAAIAQTTPIACERVSRSPSVSRARITVLAG